jgi:hypothetical protein
MRQMWRDTPDPAIPSKPWLARLVLGHGGALGLQGNVSGWVELAMSDKGGVGPALVAVMQEVVNEAGACAVAQTATRQQTCHQTGPASQHVRQLGLH